MINLTATAVSVYTGGWGTDRIVLTLTTPSGTWPYEGGATASIDIAKGHAQEWLKEHFPSIDPEIVVVK